LPTKPSSSSESEDITNCIFRGSGSTYLTTCDGPAAGSFSVCLSSAFSSAFPYTSPSTSLAAFPVVLCTSALAFSAPPIELGLSPGQFM